MEILIYITLTHLIIGFICSLYFAYLCYEVDEFDYDEFIICIKLVLAGFVSLAILIFAIYHEAKQRKP